MPGSQKYWRDGLPYTELDGSGDQKYWRDGLPQEGIEAVGVATVTVTHTTDALFKGTLTRVHTTDALLEKALTLSHTTDALLTLVGTLTHTTDALLKATLTRSHTTDAFLASSGIEAPCAYRDTYSYSAVAARLDIGRRRCWVTNDRLLIAAPVPPDLPEFAAFQFTDRFQYNIVRARVERRVSFSVGGPGEAVIWPDAPDSPAWTFLDRHPHRALAERATVLRRISGVYDDQKTAPFLNFPDSATVQYRDAYPFRKLAVASETARRISAYFDPNALYDWSWVEPAFYRDRFNYRAAARLQAFLRAYLGSQTVIGVPIATPPTAPTVVGRVVTFCYEDRTLMVRAETRPQVSFEVRGVYAMPTAEVTCVTFVKDPQAVKDYWIDWRDPDAPLLETGETIATSSWTGGGLTVVSATWSGDRATVFLSGGTVGTTHLPKNTITTTSGRTYAREIRVLIQYT